LQIICPLSYNPFNDFPNKLNNAAYFTSCGGYRLTPRPETAEKMLFHRLGIRCRNKISRKTLLILSIMVIMGGRYALKQLN